MNQQQSCSSREGGGAGGCGDSNNVIPDSVRDQKEEDLVLGPGEEGKEQEEGAVDEEKKENDTHEEVEETEEQKEKKEDLSPYNNEADGSSFSSDDDELPAYYAPPELQMSDQEEGWALNLIQWMEGGDRGGNSTPAVTQPSDFEYALHAIINKGNRPEQAEQKIRALQKFRQTYNIQDTVEEGIKAFQDFFQLHPGHLLQVDTMGSKGSLVAIDSSKWFPARGRESSYNLRVQMVFSYYLFLVCAPNFDVVRGGIHFLAEGSDMSCENIDVGLENQIVQELFNHVPLQWKQIRLYNNTPIITSMMDLVKTLMPKEVQNVISAGCQLDNLNYDHSRIGTNHPHINDPTGSPLLNGILNSFCPPPPKLTLPHVFLQPNYNVAMQNLIIKVRALLEERYHNEESFELFAEVPTPPSYGKVDPKASLAEHKGLD